MDNTFDSLEQMDKDFVLHTYARDYTHFTHGNGARVYSAGGDDYIDFTAGIGVNSLGHNHKQLVETISSQAGKILHVSNLFLIESQARLAQRISHILGTGVRTFFSNSGLEANECAIKIARLYGEFRNAFKIITLKNSFHGRSIATLAACAQSKMHEHFAPFPVGFIYADDISSALKIAKNDKAVVAIMLELIQGEGGIHAMPKNEVLELRAFTQENDILLIVDEIQSGVYRSGEFLSAMKYGIMPDVVSLAKGLAGGVPIGATITNKIDIFKAGDHGSTFGGNFLATSVGMCVLEVLDEYKKSGELDSHIAYFSQHLQEIQARHSNVFNAVCGLGFMRGLKMENDKILGELIAKAKKERLLVLKSGGSTLRLLPPILITKSEMDDGFGRLEKAILQL